MKKKKLYLPIYSEKEKQKQKKQGRYEKEGNRNTSELNHTENGGIKRNYG